MKVNERNLIKYLFFIVALIVSILVLILIKYSQNILLIKEDIKQQIQLTGWPEEVPIISKNGLEIKVHMNPQEDLRGSWGFKLYEGVSYLEYRDYLIKLEEIGFKPVTEYGSKSPKLLNLNPEIDEDFFIGWYGKWDKYNVEVFWQNVIGQDKDDKLKKYNFSISLYEDLPIVSGESTVANLPIDSGDIDTISGDLLSGDFVFGSGEIFE